MCIYCGTNHYRRIYENHHGKIPKDETGRSYEIHHIDGNRSNNDPENLKCVTIKEHYDIHYAQSDWGACWLISRKMKLTNLELSELNRLIQVTRIANGTHPFLGDLQKRKVSDGTHHFLGGKIQRKMVQDGIHPWQNKDKATARNKTRVANGTHPFLGGDQSRKNNKKMLESGTHPSQIKMKCTYCDKSVSVGMFTRWHGENCKLRK